MIVEICGVRVRPSDATLIETSRQYREGSRRFPLTDDMRRVVNRADLLWRDILNVADWKARHHG